MIDKNRAPGAAEAFKAVGNAVAILTDAEKRKSYDLYGSNEQRNIGRSGFNSRSGHTFTQYGYSRGFEADVTAEELFNMFFGGGAFSQQNAYPTRNRHYHRNQEREDREVSLFGSQNKLFLLLSNFKHFPFLSNRAMLH